MSNVDDSSSSSDDESDSRVHQYCGVHWPTSYRIKLSGTTRVTDRRLPQPIQPKRKKHQPVKFQLPPLEHGCIDAARAYVGNTEFLLPYGQTRSSKYRYGRYLKKNDAVEQLLKTKKGSRERRALIHFMIDQSLVPCKENYLYKLMKQASEYGIESLGGGANDYWWEKYHENSAHQEEMKVVIRSYGKEPISYGFLDVGNVKFEVPYNGKFYTKREALNWIAKTKKGSRERGAMIRFMVQGGYVPCKENCLYELVRRVEMERLPVGSDDWGKQGRPTNETASKKTIASEKLTFPNVQDGIVIQQGLPYCYTSPARFDFDEKIRYDDRIFGRGRKGSKKLQNIGELMKRDEAWAPSIPVCNRNGWKDCIMLDMIPVRFCDNLREKLASGYHEEIDICTYIGYNIDCLEDKKTNRTYRLYFHPEDFPPPINMNVGGNSVEFSKVKSYIRTTCHVFCNGGKYERVFVCDRNKRGHKEPYCPFRFTVRWDKYGFYIFLLPNQKAFRNRGCPWHCCSGTNAEW